MNDMPQRRALRTVNESERDKRHPVASAIKAARERWDVRRFARKGRIP
jgi:hypothetical protein